jgi:hypothetical protein
MTLTPLGTPHVTEQLETTRLPRLARVLRLIALTGLVVYAVHTWLTGDGAQLGNLLGRPLFFAVCLFGALAGTIGAFARKREFAGWLLLALGVTSYGLGLAYYFQHESPIRSAGLPRVS